MVQCPRWIGFGCCGNPGSVKACRGIFPSYNMIVLEAADFIALHTWSMADASRYIAESFHVPYLHWMTAVIELDRYDFARVQGMGGFHTNAGWVMSLILRESCKAYCLLITSVSDKQTLRWGRLHRACLVLSLNERLYGPPRMDELGRLCEAVGGP